MRPPDAPAESSSGPRSSLADLAVAVAALGAIVLHALQSAVGGMLLSLAGTVLAALAQEAIDLLAILNALRVSVAPKDLGDF